MTQSKVFLAGKMSAFFSVSICWPSALCITVLNVIFPEMVTRMNWSRGDASWGQTLHGLLYGVFVPLAAFSVNKWGARATILTGIVVLIIGCILLGTVTTSITVWIIIWGVVMSFGFAFGGVIPIQTTVAQWFDKQRATAIGLVMTAAGVGGFIAQPLFTWIMGAFWRLANGLAFRLGVCNRIYHSRRVCYQQAL